MRTSEVLNKAADLIEERGWQKGSGWVVPSSSPEDSLCLEGGIQAAAGIVLPEHIDDVTAEPLQTCPAYMAVRNYLGDALSGRFLWAWNDRRGSASEVIEVLRACAVIEAAREDQDAAAVTYADNLAAVSA